MMKKITLLIITFLAISIGVNAQDVNIPDANFKAYLVGVSSINTNGDTSIQVTEANAFNGTINCNTLSISDLTGIEAFTSLKKLYCQNNQLTNLNLSANTALTYLNSSNNQLTSLDLSANTALTYLNYSNNQISNLDLSNNTGLIYLFCNNNQIANLDLSANTALIRLSCTTNQLTSLDLSTNTSMFDLNCSVNQLTSLDLSVNTALTKIYCGDNQITSLDLTANTLLENLFCNNNQLTSLNIANTNNVSILNMYADNNFDLVCIGVDDVAYSTANWTHVDSTVSFSTNCPPPCTVNIPDANFKAYLVGNASINTNGNTQIECSEATAFNATINCNSLSISDLTGIEAFTSLKKLYCYNNQISNLDVSQNTALNYLTCYGNQLTNLDLSNNTALTYLNYSDNQITNLDLSANTDLIYLFCNDNQITNLDLSNNTALVKLSCTTNQLTSLDLSANTVLSDLNCSVNQLTNLDLSANPALTKVYCGDNQITDLDVSAQTILQHLFSNNNQLTSLNVANTNNANMINMYADNNPALTCIEVDNVAYSNTNWTHIDSIANFSTDCNACTVNIPDANFKAYLVANTSINTNGDTEIQCSEASTYNGEILCSSSSITDLTGIEAFTALTKLNFYNNSVTNVDLSQNIALKHLDCQGNSLTSLDLSLNTALTYFTGHNNSLTSLNIANGNNTNITYFYVKGNPDLTCIEVDDVAYSTTNWTNNIDATANFSTDCDALVYAITVQGQGNISAITTNGGTLQMEAIVLPATADDDTYTWSVVDGTGSATIDDNGLLTATADGTVEVIATANDASGTTGTKTITISNQSVGINDLAFQNVSVYPNPTNGVVNLNISETLSSIKIMDLTGKTMEVYNPAQRQLDISNFTAGIYFLEIANAERKSVVKIIKK